MCTSISALARDETADLGIESHVENATSPASDATESVAYEATRLLVEVIA